MFASAQNFHINPHVLAPTKTSDAIGWAYDNAYLQLSDVTDVHLLEIDDATRRFNYWDRLSRCLVHQPLPPIAALLEARHSTAVHIDLGIRDGLFSLSSQKLGLSWGQGCFEPTHVTEGVQVYKATCELPPGTFSSCFIREMGASYFCSFIKTTFGFVRIKNELGQIGLDAEIQVLPVRDARTALIKGPGAGKHMRLLLSISRDEIVPITRMLDPQAPCVYFTGQPALNFKDLKRPLCVEKLWSTPLVETGPRG